MGTGTGKIQEPNCDNSANYIKSLKHELRKSKLLQITSDF